MQPQSGTLHSGMLISFGDRLCPGGRMRHLQGIPRRQRGGTLFCKECKSSYALVFADGYRRGRTHQRKPFGVDEGRGDLRRYGFQPVSGGCYRLQIVGDHHGLLPRSIGYHSQCTLNNKGSSLELPLLFIHYKLHPLLNPSGSSFTPFDLNSAS